MARLDEARIVVGSAECREDSVDAVAGMGEHVVHLPLTESREQVVSNCVGRSASPWRVVISHRVPDRADLSLRRFANCRQLGLSATKRGMSRGMASRYTRTNASPDGVREAIRGAAPARSALTLRTVLAWIGASAFMGGAVYLGLTHAPTVAIVILAIFAAIGLIDLVVIARARKRATQNTENADNADNAEGAQPRSRP